MKKKALSLLLTLAMLLSLVPAFGTAASATETTETVGSYTVLLPDGITLPNGAGSSTTVTLVSPTDAEWGTASTTTWYVATGTVTIDHTVTVKGDVHLILANECALTVNVSTDDQAGICVSGTGNSLTIYAQSTGSAMGELTANGGACAAGIGGGYGADGENITINGGTVTATGGSLYYYGYCDGGAGIGGGYNGDGKSITINDGTVIAQGGYYAAGVGGGYNPGGGTKGNGDHITINGGTVTATGGKGDFGGGAGIGGGIDGIGSNISITGGTVTATCGSKNDDTFADGAAIGNGHTNREISASNITVSAGLTVKAGNDTPPTAVIAHTDAQDLASSFANKHYVTIVPPILVCYVDTNKNGALDSGEIKYPSIAAALAAAHNDEDGTHPTEIVLIADDTENVTIPEGRNITLDLNGYVLKAKDAGSVILNRGKLTIKDSDAAKSSDYAVHYFKYSKTGAWVLNDDAADKSGAITVSAINGDTADNTLIKVTGGAITGGTGTNTNPKLKGGGVFNFGNLTLESGNIVGNKAGNGGGIFTGIMWDSFSAFTMTGGNIIGNKADTYGGGIGVNSYCVVKLLGGTITRNKAAYGGGVESGWDGRNPYTLGGSINIIGNTAPDGTTPKNLHVYGNYTVTLGTGTEAPNTTTGGMKIGVTLDSVTGKITSNGASGDEKYFFSDNENYTVKFVAADGGVAAHLELVKKESCYIGTNTSSTYPSISAALAAEKPAGEATTPTTVTLIADSEENVTIPADRNITLDLNDHVLKAASAGNVIINSGNLTITDSNTVNRTTRYFTDEKCTHGKTVGTACTDCGTNAVADGCYETYYDTDDGLEEGTYLTVTGGVITGGNDTNCLGGGAVYSAEGTTLTASHINFVGNKCGGNGGGAVKMEFHSLKCNFSYVVVAGNLSSAYSGGVFTKAKESRFDHCQFLNNINTGADAGGLSAAGDETYVSDCVFEENIADWAGSAIAAYSYLELKNVTIKNNHITDVCGDHCGGAVFLETWEEEPASYLYLDGEIYIADNTFGDDKVPSNVILLSPPDFETSLRFGEDFALKDEDKPIGIMLSSDYEWDYLPMVGSISEVCSADMADLFYAEGNAYYQNNAYYVKYDTDHLAYAAASVIIARGITNGKVKVNNQEAAVGEEVTVTVTPKAGYVLDTLTVTDKDGAPIEASNNTFTMPSAEAKLPVTVSATFKQASHSSDIAAITVPVSGDKDTVKVSATVSGSNATINNVTSEEIAKVGTGAEVTIDLSDLSKSVTGVIIPKTTFENVAASSAKGLEIKLPNGTIAVFDKTTLKAVASQAKGANIQLVVDRDSKAEQTLTTAQKATVKEMNKPVVLDAYFVSNGVRISDFKGGKANITATYETTNPVRVWYVADDGTKELVPSTFDGKAASFTVTHFSHYVIEMLDGSSYDTCPQDSTCVYAKFSDANPKEWYHSGIHFCVDMGYMNGITATQFAPNGTLSRGMIVTMLWRMEGSPVVNYAMSFTDVPADFWYTEAIRWAQSTGVVLGYDDVSFGPEDDVTREQLAAILMRYAAYKGYDVSARANLDKFCDVKSISGWALENVRWANAVGLIKGRTETTIAPTGNATRAEAACMVQRFCENAAR